jgi:hypothetical protein
MLMVNSGRLGRETITNPAVEGMLASNMTMATIKLRPRKSTFENNRLILLRPVLRQSSLAFKIRWLYAHFVAGHLDWQLHRDARCEAGFHRFQLVPVAAESADQASVGTGITLMINVTSLAGVEGGFNPARAVTGQKEPNLLARPIPVREKLHITRPQIVALNESALVDLTACRMRFS